MYLFSLGHVGLLRRRPGDHSYMANAIELALGHSVWGT